MKVLKNSLLAVFLLVPFVLNAEEMRLEIALEAPVHNVTLYGDVLEVP